mgnify:CR=1 FL=1
MNKTVIAILVIFSCFVATITAQEVKSPFLPEIHGTIRAKYEYEPVSYTHLTLPTNSRV